MSRKPSPDRYRTPGHPPRPPRATVNMADVAAAAGVSVSTVSRALRGLPGVGDEQRRRIIDIATRLSYVVSPDASRLARGGTGRIAVVLDNVDRWFFGTVLAGGRMGDYECVRIDDVAAAHEAVSHLTSLGHRRIAMLRTRDRGGAVWPT